jgi:HD superfamily phosphohydrolase
MSKLWPKVIRDPVHDIIQFEDTPCDRLLLSLIDTPEFQRLRRIRQLGMSDLVFPSANHSRFSHCVGTMHVARKMVDQAIRLTGKKIREDQRTTVLVAALLHDIGHGPFSHAFEKVTAQSHEARTLEIIADPSTGVHQVLTDFDKELPARLAVFFDEDTDAEKRKKAEIPEFLTQVVSSQLDADRFDYLLRDSLATGTDYGSYDLNWLLIQLLVDLKHNRFYLSRKAVSAAEAYVFARHHMYRSVYFHKTVRAAEVMVRLVLRRFKERLDASGSLSQKQNVVPGSPSAVFDAFAKKPSLGRYLEMDDTTVTEFFKACADARDPVLRSLGLGLVERKLYKGVDATDADGALIGTFVAKAQDVVRSAKLKSDYHLVDDTAADMPYKPYDPDASRPASQIYVQTPKGDAVEISTKAPALKELRQKYSLVRYYFPESIRGRIEGIARDTIVKEERK